MNEKEISEIRRRFRLQKSNITHICGCYVNDKQQIVSQFDQPFSIMPEDETENMLGVLKRTLSGTLGKNLTDIAFSTGQVVDSDEHRLLMALRDSALKNEEAVQAFYQKIIEVLLLEGSYLILLAYDTYDIPSRAKDGSTLADASTDVYSYILCSICPVKMTKPTLSYDVPQNLFRNRKTDWLVAPPELGFLFPAFDDRCANIYNALYYSRDTAENHGEFVDGVFKTDIPMPAAAQKEVFQSILAETLSEDCSYEVVQAVHEQLCGMIEEHKVNKEIDPLLISKKTVKRMLESCGVEESHVAAFDEQYNASFGEDTEISPRNLVDAKRFAVKTPDVSIQVNPERGDLVETRIIDGQKYILIRADEGVEVNGVAVQIVASPQESNLPSANGSAH